MKVGTRVKIRYGLDHGKTGTVAGIRPYDKVATIVDVKVDGGQDGVVSVYASRDLRRLGPDLAHLLSWATCLLLFFIGFWIGLHL